ncbi:hypothetical protein, partial [Agrobacterium vitis]|uniref:hypothetical protein n=1 Tax=Agrobacterium vitis TaxID=373 RepID=UPI001AEE9EA3
MENSSSKWPNLWGARQFNAVDPGAVGAMIAIGPEFAAGIAEGVCEDGLLRMTHLLYLGGRVDQGSIIGRHVFSKPWIHISCIEIHEA